jgi:hypothetical protein
MTPPLSLARLGGLGLFIDVYQYDNSFIDVCQFKQRGGWTLFPGTGGLALLPLRRVERIPRSFHALANLQTLSGRGGLDPKDFRQPVILSLQIGDLVAKLVDNLDFLIFHSSSNAPLVVGARR